MKPVKQVNEKYYGELNGKQYLIQDDHAEVFLKRWQDLKVEVVVRSVLNDTAFWGESLSIFPGFENAVIEKLNLLMNSGVKDAVEFVQSKKEIVA
jgi:tagaturonate reductase